MSELHTANQSVGRVKASSVGLDIDVTIPVCEGLNIVLASFQGLYLQYQKHHFVVEGADTPQEDGCFTEPQMVEHDLAVEKSPISLLRSQVAQAESLCARATRYLLEQLLLTSEERVFYLAPFWASDSLKVA